MTQEEIERKKRCSTCIYHGKIGGGVAFQLGGIICQYILIERKRRPCPAQDCTVYKQGKQKKTIEKEWWENNF